MQELYSTIQCKVHCDSVSISCPICRLTTYFKKRQDRLRILRPRKSSGVRVKWGNNINIETETQEENGRVEN